MPARTATAERRKSTRRANDDHAIYIEKIVAQAPKLTLEQRDRLAVLLRGEAA